MSPPEALLTALFALCLAGCLYVYLGYPALILALSRVRPRPVARGPVRPRVTVIVPARNEEAVLETKLESCLRLDYPPDRLQVVVVSDGSADRTEEIVRGYASRGVELVAIPPSGKAAALDAGVARARGEVLVLTDANALLAPDALTRLVEPFADPEVGGVCGRKKTRTDLRPAGGQPAVTDATEVGENLYWRWDAWQKRLESRIGSAFAADGTLYALRRELYVPIEDPAQADDIAISARVVLQGRRLVYEPRAVAFEEPPAEGREEFLRKVRVTNHSVRALLNLGAGLWSSGFYSVELLSHKLLRHLVPFLLVPLFASNLALAAMGAAPFGLLLIPHGGFYALAAAGFLLRGTRAGRNRILSIPYYFSMVNAAALLGVLSILWGHRRARWEPRQGL